MKQALIIVGSVAFIAFLAAGAQQEGERLGTDSMGWLFGGPQAPPVTAPTGEFPSNPALGARPAGSNSRLD
jgi:hypothetical protein